MKDNNLLFHKQFGFRKGHSTDHALIIEHINRIYYFLIKQIHTDTYFDTDNNILTDR